jgi:dihydrofolate reductase
MHVFLIAAVTVDGHIGRSADDRSFDWTSPEDKQFYVEKIKQADVIVMGMRSFETFTRYPKNSRWMLYSREPNTFANPKPETIRAEATDEDPTELLKRLESEGVKTVAICGGASIYTLFMQAGLVNTLYLTVEPVIFGQGVKLFSGNVQAQLQLREIKKLSEETIVLDYQVKH